MYYNVIVKDTIEIYDGNSLVFHFSSNLKEAMKFASMVLNTTNYHIEILQFEKEEE